MPPYLRPKACRWGPPIPVLPGHGGRGDTGPWHPGRPRPGAGLSAVGWTGCPGRPGPGPRPASLLRAPCARGERGGWGSEPALRHAEAPHRGGTGAGAGLSPRDSGCSPASRRTRCLLLQTLSLPLRGRPPEGRSSAGARPARPPPCASRAFQAPQAPVSGALWWQQHTFMWLGTAFNWGLSPSHAVSRNAAQGPQPPLRHRHRHRAGCLGLDQEDTHGDHLLSSVPLTQLLALYPLAVPGCSSRQEGASGRGAGELAVVARWRHTPPRPLQARAELSPSLRMCRTG